MPIWKRSNASKFHILISISSCLHALFHVFIYYRMYISAHRPSVGSLILEETYNHPRGRFDAELSKVNEQMKAEKVKREKMQRERDDLSSQNYSADQELKVFVLSFCD